MQPVKTHQDYHIEYHPEDAGDRRFWVRETDTERLEWKYATPEAAEAAIRQWQDMQDRVHLAEDPRAVWDPTSERWILPD